MYELYSFMLRNMILEIIYYKIYKISPLSSIIFLIWIRFATTDVLFLHD